MSVHWVREWHGAQMIHQRRPREEHIPGRLQSQPSIDEVASIVSQRPQQQHKNALSNGESCEFLDQYTKMQNRMRGAGKI